MTAARVAAAPMSEASTMAPLRILYMYRPTKSAMGMVRAMVKVPQDEPGTTCTQPAGRRTVPPAPGASSEAPAGSRTRDDPGPPDAAPPPAEPPGRPGGRDAPGAGR